MYRIGLIILLFIIFIYTTTVLCYRSTENNLLSGFWKGSPDFCEDSELDILLIYIGDDNNSTKPGYILMKNADGLIINDQVEFCLSGGYSITPGMSHEKIYTVDIKWLVSEGYDFFPSQQKIYYYPLLGKLVMLDSNGDITALLYKDNVSSDIANKLPPETMDDESEEI